MQACLPKIHMQIAILKATLQWETLKMTILANNITFSRNGKISGEDSENKLNFDSKPIASENKIIQMYGQKPSIVQNNSATGFSIIKRDHFKINPNQDKSGNQLEKAGNNLKTSTSRGIKETSSRPTLIMKHNLSHQEPHYKVRAASSSLNRKNDDRFLFRPPMHTTINAPTPNDREDTKEQINNSFKFEVPARFQKGSVSKNERNTETILKIKHASIQKTQESNQNYLKRSNKIPLGKKDMNSSTQNRSNSRNNQISAK